VLAWGDNSFGQLGPGTKAASRATPVQVKLQAGRTAIVIGSGPIAGFSLAIVH
jgi:hypothetical protein